MGYSECEHGVQSEGWVYSEWFELYAMHRCDIQCWRSGDELYGVSGSD